MFRLFLTFLHIGIVGFGGLGAVLSLIERELVTKQKVLTADDVSEALTYTKLLPGSTVVQVVSYLGMRLGGWLGSTLATIAFLLPSFFIMLLLSILYKQVSDIYYMNDAIKGINAVVVGLLLVTAYKLGRSSIKNKLGSIIALGSLVLALFYVPIVGIVVVAGLIGIVTVKGKEREQEY